MRRFTQIAADVNVAPLAAQLAQHPQLWDQIDYRRTGKDTPHAQMQDVWCRYADIHQHLREGTLEQMREPFLPIFYPAWHILTALHPLVFTLMALIRAEMLGGIFITRIRPGGKIAPHVDDGWHPKNFTQFYLSVQSAPGAVFACEDEAIEPKTGDVWAFKNTQRHWVNNDSDQDRITAIIALRSAQFQ